MKKIITVFLAIVLVFSLCACGAGREAEPNDFFSGSVTSGDKSGAADLDDAKNEGMIQNATGNVTSVDSAIYTDPDAKIIRNAVMTIQTVTFDQSVQTLAALTESNGGYYETAQISSGGYYNQNARRSAYYIVRIPKENFTAFRDSVGNIGHIYEISEDSKNVGEVYYDTEMRLETLKTKQERLLVLLDQAVLMEDIISLEDALEEVQYEIDSLSTTLRKYDSLIDYSTFTIQLNEVIEIKEEPGVQDSFWDKFVGQLQNGWSSFADGVLNFVLWLARNIISLVIIAAVIYVVVRLMLRWRKKRRNNTEL